MMAVSEEWITIDDAASKYNTTKQKLADLVCQCLIHIKEENGFVKLSVNDLDTSFVNARAPTVKDSLPVDEILLTTTQAAEILGIAPRTLRNNVAEGRLSGVKAPIKGKGKGSRYGFHWRFRRADVDAFALSRKKCASGSPADPPTPPVKPDFTDVECAAQRLGIHQVRVAKLCREGRVPGAYLGRSSNNRKKWFIPESWVEEKECGHVDLDQTTLPRIKIKEPENAVRDRTVGSYIGEHPYACAPSLQDELVTLRERAETAESNFTTASAQVESLSRECADLTRQILYLGGKVVDLEDAGKESNEKMLVAFSQRDSVECELLAARKRIEDLEVELKSRPASLWWRSLLRGILIADRVKAPVKAVCQECGRTQEESV